MSDGRFLVCSAAEFDTNHSPDLSGAVSDEHLSEYAETFVQISDHTLPDGAFVVENIKGFTDLTALGVACGRDPH